MNRRTIALAAVSLLLASCGGGHDGHSASDMPATAGDGHDDNGHGGGGHDEPASPVANDAREIAITATDLAFDPDEITAEAGEDLAIVLTSGDILHDFVTDELDGHVVADRGETVTGGVSVDGPGTYTYYCSVPGHRDAGMEGTLTVR